MLGELVEKEVVALLSFTKKGKRMRRNKYEMEGVIVIIVCSSRPENLELRMSNFNKFHILFIIMQHHYTFTILSLYIRVLNKFQKIAFKMNFIFTQDGAGISRLWYLQAFFLVPTRNCTCHSHLIVRTDSVTHWDPVR